MSLNYLSNYLLLNISFFFLKELFFMNYECSEFLSAIGSSYSCSKLSCSYPLPVCLVPFLLLPNLGTQESILYYSSSSSSHSLIRFKCRTTSLKRIWGNSCCFLTWKMILFLVRNRLVFKCQNFPAFFFLLWFSMLIIKRKGKKIKNPSPTTFYWFEFIV